MSVVQLCDDLGLARGREMPSGIVMRASPGSAAANAGMAHPPFPAGTDGAELRKLYLFTHIHFDVSNNEDKVIEINVRWAWERGGPRRGIGE